MFSGKIRDIATITVSTPSKIKVNTKRVSANNTLNIEPRETDEILIIEEEQYENQKQVA